MLAFQRILIGSVDYIFAELQHHREVYGSSDITVLASNRQLFPEWSGRDYCSR